MAKAKYSSIPAGIATDSSSYEVEEDGKEITSLDVDVAFRLDLKRFPSSDGEIGHQLVLTVAKMSSRVKAANIEIRHLTDLGVMTFSPEDPDLDDDVICRQEDNQDYWTSAEGLRQVWESLRAELQYYRTIWLTPPHVKDHRPLRIAIGGMKYFNGFLSPRLLYVAPVYLSEETESLNGDPDDLPDLPNLFL